MSESRMGRRLRMIGFAILLAGLALPGAAAPVAAVPNLTLVAATTYEVLPDEGRIIVTAEITATNRLKDSVARRFYFRTAYLAVLPGASHLAIRGGSGSPKVSVTRRAADHTELKIDLGANLASGKSTRLTLTFEVRDPGGAPDRPVRISPSLVTFDAWAFATPDTGGSSVTVILPAGYGVEIGRGPLEGPTATGDGRQAWTSGRLAAPLEFVADIAADRPADLVESRVELPMAEGAAVVLVRSWPDDPAWGVRVAALLERALPVLEREVGLPWPLTEPLAVEESLVRGGAAFAGLFEPAENRIEVAYSAPDGVILHELAHAWFNGRLVADRWIAEAFAAQYAALAAAELGVDPATPALTPDLERLEIPLNDWAPAGRDAAPTDDYGYAASAALAHEIAARAGDDDLAEVWAAVAARDGAYPPPSGDVEAVAETPDWRALLDLLEDRTGRSFEDLWRRWVARPGDLAILRERAATRAAYAATLDHAGDWHLPRSVRDALRAWRFDLAASMLEVANRVLEHRDELAREAAAAGVVPPPTLRAAFEGEAGLEAAEAEALAELATVAAIREAQASRPVAAGFVDQATVAAGLLLADPEDRLADAAAAFASGDLEAAFEAAAGAEDVWSSAATVGRGRIVSTGLLALSTLLLVGFVRQRRRGAVRAAA